MPPAPGIQPIPAALIGFGFSARTFHLPFLKALPQFRVCAVSTRQTDHLHLLDKGVIQYSDADSLLEESDAQLVIITSPNDTHFSLAQRALELDKDVVIDKPFVCTSAEGEVLITLARQKGRVLSVYQNRRWDGDFLTLRSLIDSGRLGTLHSFETHFDRFRPSVRERWREQPGSGTGIWYDLGPHLLDQTLQLFGKPTSISARLSALRPGCEVVDYFHVQLHYPELEAVLHSSPFCAAPNLRFQLEGSGGSFRKYGLDPQEERLIAGIDPVDPDWSKESPEAWGQLYNDKGSEPVETVRGGYQHYYKQLASALLGEGENPVPPEQALETIRLIELAEISNREGRRITL